MKAAFVLATAVVMMAAMCAARITSHSLTRYTPASWVTTGEAMASNDFVRLVPDRQSKRGGFWNMEPVLFPSWQVQYDLRVHGVSNVGADGLAFWYVKEPSLAAGPLFGSEELFSGIGVILDTYDNENTGTHPYLFALKNDGTYRYTFKEHDHRDHTKGVNNVNSIVGELEGCTAKLRNYKDISSIKVSYVSNNLQVSFRTTPTAQWSDCFTVPNLMLPTGYYFGFTAATGDLADDHDVYNITVIDPTDSPLSKPFGAPVSCPAVTQQQQQQQYEAVSGDPAIAGMQRKLDGVVEVVKDTLKTLAARPTGGAVAAGGSPQDFDILVNQIKSVSSQSATIQSQLNEVSNLIRSLTSEVHSLKLNSPPVVNTVNPTTGPKTTAAMSTSTGVSLTFFFICMLGVGGLAAYLFVQLNKERRSKKLF